MNRLFLALAAILTLNSHARAEEVTNVSFALYQGFTYASSAYIESDSVSTMIFPLPLTKVSGQLPFNPPLEQVGKPLSFKVIITQVTTPDRQIPPEDLIVGAKIKYLANGTVHELLLPLRCIPGS